MKSTFYKSVLTIAFSAVLAMLSGCRDTMKEENRFTFTGELISGHLEKHPEKFSKFTEILKKAKLGNKGAGSILKTLSTYGSYTCFAPTNEAVEAFLEEQVAQKNPEITSTDVNDLSEGTATKIAKNHIIEMGYRTIEVHEGSFPMTTMNNRLTTVEWITDESGRTFTLLNNKSRIIEQDLKMENGYIQVVDAVMNPSNEMLPDHLNKQKAFNLLHQAIAMTGIDSILNIHEIDPEYDPLAKGVLLDSEEQVCPLPKEKKQRYTLLAEPDALFKSLGYETIDDIIELANKWYNYDEKGNKLSEEILKNYRHKDNPLYRFVAYHIIDRQLSYSSSTGPGGFIMQNYENANFKSDVNLSKNFDSYDYFETLLPYAMIKVTKPYTNEALKQEIIINYGQEKGQFVKDPEMANHINVVVDKISATKKKYPELKDFEQTALNGIIHTIDRILIYNEKEMIANVLNERIRIDLGSIMPELTNNAVRWSLSKDGETATYIPGDFSKNLKINGNDCEIFYLRPHSTELDNYALMQGDELLVEGKYDFEYRIPSVPPGDYEIRFGYGKGYYRGVCQFYFDGKITGIPVDLRWNEHTEALIGWEPVKDLSEEDAKLSDKAMRNRGYMRGPASIVVDAEAEHGTLRDSEQALRKIIGIFKLDKRPYWIRFKDVSDAGSSTQFEQDYLELVPTRIINDISKPEDIY